MKIRRADRDVASETMAEWMEEPRPGRSVTSLSADTGTWRERFARCAALARRQERERIGSLLLANPKGER